jgi:hypothetical protein
MEKYQNPKTIGDGTYGSVLRAVNSQNGKRLNPPLIIGRWNCGDQAHEEEVQSVGPVHQPEGDLISDEAGTPEHRPAVRGHSGAEHLALCIRVPWPKCVPADERAEEALSWEFYPQHHVSVVVGAGLHAQVEFFPQRSEARKSALLP